MGLRRHGAVALVAFAAGGSYGYLVHRNHLFPYEVARGWLERAAGEDAPPRTGYWARVPAEQNIPPGEESEEAALARLRAVGYLGGTRKGASGAGVTVFRRDAVSPGLNLVASGHAPELWLMRSDGTVLQRWRTTFREAFPDVADDGKKTGRFFRSADLLPNGDVLAIFAQDGLVRLDKRSRVLWSLPGAHHEATVGADGNIYALTRTAHVRTDFHPTRPFLEDYIAVLTPDGRELRVFSLLEALRRSGYGGLLDAAWRNVDKEDGDPLHTNELELVEMSRILGDGSSGLGALVSFRRLNTVAVVSLETEELVWVLPGVFLRQHDPTLLPGPRLLAFDNRTPRLGSRALELDLRTGRVVWQYPPEAVTDVFSHCCGNAQRLPNGNTLITFSEPGRAVEVTPDGEVVWEFANPHRAGAHDEFVAQLMQMQRLPADFPLDWLAEGEPAEN